MVPKERLRQLKDVLLILKRERDLRADPRMTVLQEAYTLQVMIGTIEGFLNDKDLVSVVGVVGGNVARVHSDLQATKRLLQQWQQAASKNLVNPQAYRTFIMYSDRVLTTMADQLEQIINAMPSSASESQYLVRNAPGTDPSSQSSQSPQNTLYNAARRGIAMLVLSAAALLGGCGSPNVRAADFAGQQGITQSTREQTEEEKLYAQARELEKTDKKAAQEAYLKAIDMDMKKGSVEKILEKELANGSITLIKAPGTYYDKQEEPEWVTQYKAELNKAAKDPNVKGVLVMFYNDVIIPEPIGQGEKGLDFERRQAIILRELRQRYGREVRMIAVRAGTDPRPESKTHWYMHTWMKQWGLPPIRGPPSFALYSVMNNSIELVDVAFQSPAANAGVGATIRNCDGYWIGPLIFERDNPDKDGKRYKYNNEPKIQVVVSNK